jgi:hypothetical protein
MHFARYRGRRKMKPRGYAVAHAAVNAAQQSPPLARAKRKRGLPRRARLRDNAIDARRESCAALAKRNPA